MNSTGIQSNKIDTTEYKNKSRMNCHEFKSDTLSNDSSYPACLTKLNWLPITSYKSYTSTDYIKHLTYRAHKVIN